MIRMLVLALCFFYTLLFSQQVSSCMVDPYSSDNRKAVQYFDTGINFFESGDFQKAKTCLEQAVNSCSRRFFTIEDDFDFIGPMCSSYPDPVYFHAHFYLGRIYLLQQDYVEARSHFIDSTGFIYFDEISTLYDADPCWLIYLGLADLGANLYYHSEEDIANAIEHIDSVWTNFNDNFKYMNGKRKYTWYFQMTALAYANMAVVYYEQSNYDCALEAMLYAIAIDEGKLWNGKRNERVYVPYGDIQDDINKYPLKNHGNPSFYNNLGLIYLKLNRLEEALQAYNRALELDPNDIDTLKNRALVYLALENDQAAVQDYTDSLEKRPQDVNTRKFRAMAYWCLGNDEEANKEWLLAQQWEDETLYQDNKKGLVALSKGDYYEAIRAFSVFIKSEPLLSIGYKNRGRTYYESGQLDLALKDFDRAILLDSEDSDSYQDRGAVHLALSSNEKAIDDYQNAHDLDPTNYQILQKLGTAYFLNKEYDQAIINFSQAIGLEKNSKSYKIRGAVYFETRDYEKAIADFTQALALFSDADTYKLRGLGLHEEDKPKEAIKDFTQAMTLGCRNSQIYCQRAVAYYTNRDFANAILDFNKAVEIDPLNVEAYRGRGLVLLSMDKVREAMEDFNRAILIENPNCPLPSSMAEKPLIPDRKLISQVETAKGGKQVRLPAISQDGGKTYLVSSLDQK